MIDEVIAFCIAGGVISLLFGVYALIQEEMTAGEIKTALKEILDSAKANAATAGATGDSAESLAARNEAHSALSVDADFLKAIGTAAEGVSKLKRSVAGLFIALMFATVAGGLSVVDDKVADKEDKEDTQQAA